LTKIQADMFTRAKQVRDSQLKMVQKFEDGFVKALDAKCMIMSPWCERVKCEEDVKDRSARA
jgi:prolyl-tRNA synthetase